MVDFYAAKKEFIKYSDALKQHQEALKKWTIERQLYIDNLKQELTKDEGDIIAAVLADRSIITSQPTITDFYIPSEYQKRCEALFIQLGKHISEFLDAITEMKDSLNVTF
jgi:hypothetical protein